MITITITTERIRQLLARKGNVRQATTQEAEAFLILYGTALTDHLAEELKRYVESRIA